MAKRLSFISLVGIILSILVTTWNPVAGSSSESPAHLIDSQAKTQMLNATISITMYGFEPAQQSASGIVTKDAQPGRIQGLGTVVTHNGEQLIVTHNHWNLLNSELELVQIHNAQQQLLATVTGEAFFGLIRYQDKGTMILNAPAFANSVESVSWSSAGAIGKGSTVQVVHRRQVEQGGVSVDYATVESIVEKDGVSTFMMRSMNGHVIVPGDSGGGIWYEGQLVGNMWTTLVVNIKAKAQPEGTVLIEENWSQAAVLMRAVQEQLASPEEVIVQVGEEAEAPVTMAQGSGLPPAAESGSIG